MTQPRLTNESVHVTNDSAVGIDDPKEAATPHWRPAGDWTDDDGQALDDYFAANPNGPNLVPGTERLLTDQPSYDDTPPKISRIITRALPVGQALGTNGVASTTPQDPIQLLPKDANRKRLILRGVTPGQSDFTIANPAAGSSWSYTVPAGHTLTLRYVRFSFTTDANVANRQVAWRVTDPSGNIVMNVTAPVQAASLTNTYALSPFGGQYVAGGDVVVLSPPNFTLPAFWTLSVSITNVQVGDQVSLITVTQDDFYFRYASEKSDIYGAANVPAYRNVDNAIDLGAHTGAVWVYAPDTCGQMTVQALAVSE